MTGLKGGGLLLIMGIPLALYCVLQVKGVVRTDMIVSEPPADRGGTKEQLTAGRAKASAGLTEVRKAATIAGQFRASGAEDASADADTTTTVKAAAARAADLNDLDLFLSEVERPVFTGKLKPQYEKWMAERKDLNRDADAVTAWLSKPPPITSAADATKAMDAVNALITDYSRRSRFSDNAKAAVWRVKARLVIADALVARADSQYREAVKETLPLKAGENKVKTAADTLRELKKQIDDLNKVVKQAEEDKATLDANTRAAVDAKGAVIDECLARQELLDLFGKDDLFTNANGAAVWLKQVATQYRKTKDEKTKALIREKVQEFCDAFIPSASRLDEDVLIKGKAVPRKDVVIKFQATPGGMVMRKPLSGDLDGVNEFNLMMKHMGDTTFVVYMGSEEYPRDLKPTVLSTTAVLFNGERKKVAAIATGPKWTAQSVEVLKKKCEPQSKLVDQLQIPGGTPGKEPKLWTRLTGLADGMKGNGDLFETSP